jgi:hypothetical protein
MSQIEKIIEGIYGEFDKPIIVCGENGEILWKNKVAEGECEKKPDLLVKISSCIIYAETTSGQLDGGVRGRFHRAVIEDVVCFIVEVDNETPLENFMGCKEISAFLEHGTFLVGCAVTEISAYTGILSESCVGNSESINTIRNNIHKSCCKIIRNSLSGKLLSAVSSGDIPKRYISVDDFLENLVYGCKKHYKVELLDKLSGYILSNNTILMYLVLGLMRILLRKERIRKIEIIPEMAGEDLCLKFVCVGREKDFNLDQELYDAEMNIYNILAEKLGAYYSFDENTMKIYLKYVAEADEAIFETSKIIFDSSEFSVYNVMLDDMAN